METQILNSFHDELAKIAMARVGLAPRRHVAQRLYERFPALSRQKALQAEKEINEALVAAGGPRKLLGSGEFHLPLTGKGGKHYGSIGISKSDGPGHYMSTFRDDKQGVRPGNRPLSQSSLTPEALRTLKKKVKKIVREMEGTSKPPRTKKSNYPTRRIFK